MFLRLASGTLSSLAEERTVLLALAGAPENKMLRSCASLTKLPPFSVVPAVMELDTDMSMLPQF